MHKITPHPCKNFKLYHKPFLRVPSSHFCFVCKFFFLYISWFLLELKTKLLKYHKGAVFAIVCYKWKILLWEESLPSGFLTEGGKKALLGGSWYTQRALGDSLILQVTFANFADPTGLHTLLKAHANCPEPSTLCLYLLQWIYIPRFLEKHQCQAWLNCLQEPKIKPWHRKKKE